MSREAAEFEINCESYLLVKAEFGGSWHTICHNSGTDLCKKCQQIQCDSAGGGIPKPEDYKWLVVEKEG